MNLPQSGDEPRQMRGSLFRGETSVAEMTLPFEIVIQGSPKVLPVQIADRVAVEHPFLFGDVVIAQPASVPVNAVKDSPVD